MGTDRVQVELLHHFDIAFHQVRRDGLAAVGIELVKVRALDEDALAVSPRRLPSRICTDAQADIHGNDFNDDTAGIADSQKQLIEVGSFRRPEQRRDEH